MAVYCPEPSSATVIAEVATLLAADRTGVEDMTDALESNEVTLVVEFNWPTASPAKAEYRRNHMAKAILQDERGIRRMRGYCSLMNP